MKLRTNPAHVRLVLAHLDRHGWRATEIKFNLSSRTIARWVHARREQGPDWPGMELDAEWLATREARAKHAADLRSYRNRRYRNRGPLLVDSTGTIRRIRALNRLGWTNAHIIAHGPWKGADSIYEMTIRATVTITNRDRVAAIYERLCMTPGPSLRTQRIAIRNGWAPPLAWDDIDTDDHPRGVPADSGPDPVAIARILAGDWRMPCSPAEKVAVIDRWSGSLNELERLTGWNVRRYMKGSAA